MVYEVSYFHHMKKITGRFDGQVIVLDEPALLKPNARVKVMPLDSIESGENGLADVFARLSEPAFQRVWDNPLDADYDKL